MFAHEQSAQCVQVGAHAIGVDFEAGQNPTEGCQLGSQIQVDLGQCDPFGTPADGVAVMKGVHRVSNKRPSLLDGLGK